ncbi:recombinase [Facklamia languida]
MRAYYGYEIREGKITLNLLESNKIKQLFHLYLLGHSLQSSSELADISKTHSQIGKILSNKIYLGNEMYPSIIDNETFQRVQFEREKRKIELGRNFQPKVAESKIPLEFKWTSKKSLPHDPFERATCLYDRIEVI